MASADMCEHNWPGSGCKDCKIQKLERELAEWKASQHYRYIGIDGKPVLARDLEDRAIKAESELSAEKALADWLAEGVRDLYGYSHYLEAYNKARGL